MINNGLGLNNMKHFFYIPFLILISSCSVHEFEFNETGVKSTLVETLDFYLDANIPPTAPGMAILVVQDGIVKYALRFNAEK